MDRSETATSSVAADASLLPAEPVETPTGPAGAEATLAAADTLPPAGQTSAGPAQLTDGAVAPPVQPGRPEPRRTRAVLAAVAAVVLAGGGALVWSLRRDPPTDLSTLPVAQLLLKLNDPARIKSEADRRWQLGKREDAVLLLEEAARRGNGAAAAELARDYDPSEPPRASGALPPDARAAARYYQEASNRGADIAPFRARLRASLAAKAAAGDVLAGLTLKDFWP